MTETSEKIWLASSPHMSDEGYEMQYVQSFDSNWIALLELT